MKAATEKAFEAYIQETWKHAIVVFLEHETTKINALVSKVETVVDKLKEYRTALISAAVTGKIDVREEAI
jgi:hypothetical protein